MTDPAAPPPSPPPRHAAAQQQDPPAPVKPTPPLILASASPRRCTLLRDAGYAFTIHPADIDESDHPPSLSPEDLARYLAERKARAVAEAFPDAVVLAADTVVALAQQLPPPSATPRRSHRIPPPPPPPNPAAEPLGSRGEMIAPLILGKPADLADAHRILTLLSGTTHTVITAVAVISPDYTEITAVHSTVHMRPLAEAELDAYLASNQWQGKAGAYGIQDNDPFVTATAGCPTNIVGLPMTTTRALLAHAGIHPNSPTP